MDGVIVVDKPAGVSSAEVVRKIRKRLGSRSKVGHLGTLDPFATGVLPILVGEGTKLAPFLQEGEKLYSGLIALGAETDTLDPTGAVTREAPVPGIDAELLAAAARRFTGSIEQTPPAFSAIKRDGVRSYRLARRGIEAPPHPPRTVRINQLELAVADGRSLRFRVSCGPGMYVRALARDLGLALGTVAHLAELRRERNGSFTLDAAAPLERVLQVLEGGAPAPLIPLREALSALPEVEVDQGVAARLRHGDARALDGIAVPAARFKVVAGGRLIAVAGAVSRLTSHLERIFLDG